MIIAVTNRKGGVGKTTISTHLAAGLAVLGYNIGLVETDSQSHVAASLGLEQTDDLYELMVNRDALLDEHVPKDLKSRMLALPAGTHWVNVLNPRILPNQRWTKFPSRREQFLSWAKNTYGMVAEDVITALNETNDLQDAESLSSLEEFVGEEFEAAAAVVAKSIKYNIDDLSKVDGISEKLAKKATAYCEFFNDPIPF